MNRGFAWQPLSFALGMGLLTLGVPERSHASEGAVGIRRGDSEPMEGVATEPAGESGDLGPGAEQSASSLSGDLGPGAEQSASSLSGDPVSASDTGEDSDPSSPGRVRVDASELGTITEQTVIELGEQAALMASQRGLSPEHLRVYLVWVDPVEFIRGIRVAIITPEVEVFDETGLDYRGPLVAQCKDCSEPELKTVSVEGLIEAFRRYEELRTEYRKAQQEAKRKAAQQEAARKLAERAALQDVDPKGSRGMLGAGIAGLSVGGAAAMVGSLFAWGLVERRPSGTYMQHMVRDYQTPGYIVLAVGGVGLITGVVLLGIHRRRTRPSGVAAWPSGRRGLSELAGEVGRRRGWSHGRRVTVMPQKGTGLRGVTWGIRF